MSVRLQAAPPQTWQEHSDRYDLAYLVATGRITPEQARKMFPVTLVGEHIPAAGYEATQSPNGRPHAYADGTDPYKNGYAHGMPNNGYTNTKGRHPFDPSYGPDVPRPENKLRDDLQAEYAHKRRMRPTP